MNKITLEGLSSMNRVLVSCFSSLIVWASVFSFLTSDLHEVMVKMIAIPKINLFIVVNVIFRIKLSKIVQQLYKVSIYLF